MKDTHYRMSLGEFTATVTAYGFEEILREPFIDRGDERQGDELLLCWWHPLGVFLQIDTFHGVPNDGHVAYNWRQHWLPDEESYEYWKRTCMNLDHTSGSTLSSYTAYREHSIINGGILGHVDRLSHEGTFVVPWEHPATYWITSYQDYKDAHIEHGLSMYARFSELDKRSYDRWKRLPDHVRMATACWGEKLSQERKL